MFTPLERKLYSLGRSCRIFGSLRDGIKKCIGNLFKALLYITCFLTGFTDTAYALAGRPGGNGDAGAQGIGGMFSSFLPLILIFVIFYFLLIRPQSKKAKDHKQMLENLKKGDKIITTGGIHGLIEDIDGNAITIKIGIKDDVRVKVSRNYIADIRTGE